MEHLRRPVLRLGHVRLIEWVDAENSARNGCGDLPAQELRAHVIHIAEANSNDGIAALFQFPQGGFRAFFAVQPQVHEETVVAVDRRGAGRLPVDRDDPLPVLAGALRQQLLYPGAKPLERGRGEEGDLVPPAQRQAAEERAQLQAGAALQVFSPFQQAGEVYANRGSRHQTKAR